VEECSPATRAARVRFPVDANQFLLLVLHTIDPLFSILGHFVNVIFAMLVLKPRTSDTKIQGSCPVTIVTIMSVNCQRCEQSVGCHLNFLIKCLCYKNGEAGYRSLYPSHAKRILYHLSYIPCVSHDTLSLNNTNSLQCNWKLR
jgi:hypothetical protein